MGYAESVMIEMLFIEKTKNVIIQHLRLAMLRIHRCGATRGAARLVRSKITAIIRPKCKHFVLYSNSYLGVLNNYKNIIIRKHLQ